MLWVSSSLLEAYSPASNSCSLTSVDPQVNPVLSIAILFLTYMLLLSGYISRAVWAGKGCFRQGLGGLTVFLTILYQGHHFLGYFRL
jgi:hypothetical protein